MLVARGLKPGTLHRKHLALAILPFFICVIEEIHIAYISYWTTVQPMVPRSDRRTGEPRGRLGHSPVRFFYYGPNDD